MSGYQFVTLSSSTMVTWKVRLCLAKKKTKNKTEKFAAKSKLKFCSDLSLSGLQKAAHAGIPPSVTELK